MKTHHLSSLRGTCPSCQSQTQLVVTSTPEWLPYLHASPGHTFPHLESLHLEEITVQRKSGVKSVCSFSSDCAQLQPACLSCPTAPFQCLCLTLCQGGYPPLHWVIKLSPSGLTVGIYTVLLPWSFRLDNDSPLHLQVDIPIISPGDLEISNIPHLSGPHFMDGV